VPVGARGKWTGENQKIVIFSKVNRFSERRIDKNLRTFRSRLSCYNSNCFGPTLVILFFSGVLSRKKTDAWNSRDACDCSGSRVAGNIHVII
jgi:hypothetical protein